MAAFAITLAGTAGASADPSWKDVSNTTSTAGSMVHNPTVVTATPVGPHPSADAQPQYGDILFDLAEKDGIIYAGFGDYGANTGPIAIQGWNTGTNTWTDVLLTAPTEQVATIRDIRGDLYAPLIDPTFSWTADSGYATTAGAPEGKWVLDLGPGTPMIHTFDVTGIGDTGLVMVGSALDDKGVNSAVAYHSPGNGATWSRISLQPNASDSDVSRYYWAAQAGGKVYFQAEHLSRGANVMAFDGNRVKKTNITERLCMNTSGHGVESFNGKIVCAHMSNIRIFDGKNIVDVSNKLPTETTTSYMIHDYSVSDDGTLYAVSNNHILRTLDGLNWERFLTVDVPERLWSVHVTGDGTVYVGGYEAALYRVDVNAHDIPTVLTAPADTEPVDDGKVWNPNKPVK